ncbi:MAG: hypothetical protein KDA79_06210 [Planctomycetaceae bacterium]|nr:hypothetical protein [Planctomycetaceae bacterium]
MPVLFLTAALCAGGSLCAAEKVTETGGQTSVRLEQLPDSPSLLKAPAGANVAVAKTAPKIEFAYFPGQWEGARLWSCWGDSLRAASGKFYASVGDHDAPHGTAYVYEIDSAAGTVKLVSDYHAVVGVKDKAKYSSGKIHGAVVQDRDGKIYFFGYRGSVGKTRAEDGYKGDWLLKYDPETGKTENLGIAVPHCSVPVLLYQPGNHSLYGLAVPGKTAPKQQDRFFRYDLGEDKLVFNGGQEPNISRALILGNDGRAFFTAEKGAKKVFAEYSPQSNKVTLLDVEVPGDGRLRAASRPDSGQVAWCLSNDGVIFGFDTSSPQVTAEVGTTFPVGKAYTADVELDPTERYLYYVPGAHGRTSEAGTPVVQFDLKRKQVKAIAFLNTLLREEKGYNLGGTYGLALSEDGSQLMINFNGAPLGNKQPDFGLCSVVIVHIPESERSGK